jgi:hypothetical protein
MYWIEADIRRALSERERPVKVNTALAMTKDARLSAKSFVVS